jgi:6-phosphogluconolactonase
MGASASWGALALVTRPFAAVVLGMGEDGHIASLFPGSPDIAAELDPATAPGCVATIAPSSPHERLSLNVAALLETRRIALLITGNAKWQVYQRALEPGPAAELPVRAILKQQRVPLTVYWAPNA